MEENKDSPKKRLSVDSSRQQAEQQRQTFNVSSRTMHVTDTQIIGTILQGITGEEEMYESTQKDEVKLTPYQIQMIEWQIQRDKTTGVGTSTIQAKIEEFQAQKKGAAAMAIRQDLKVEFKEEDPPRQAEVVGLDDALLELRIQEDYLSKKLNKNGLMSRMNSEFGIGAILSSNSSSSQRYSINDGKQLISLAYGIKAEGVTLESRESVKDHASSFGSLSQQFNASISQLILKGNKGQNLITEEELEESNESTSEVESNKEDGNVGFQEEKMTPSGSDGSLDHTQRNIRSKEIIIRVASADQEEKPGQGADHFVSELPEVQTKPVINSPRAKKLFAKSTSTIFPEVQSGVVNLSSNLSKDLQGEEPGANGLSSLPISLPNSGESKRRRYRPSKANTLVDVHLHMHSLEEEDASSKIIREAREKEKGQFNLRQILKYFSILKRDRTKEQTALLTKYLKTIKVFIDIILRGALDKGTSAAIDEAEITFEHLAASIKVQKHEAGAVLFEEGSDGELFYIIMQGKCELLKASPVTIHSMTHSEAIEDRTPPYFHVFMENYDEIFWSGMDITRQEVDDMLGILRDDGEGGSGQIIQIPEWPISKKKQLILQGYIRRHEKNPEFRNHKHEPIILVNKHLVNLQTGAGFGELALIAQMSESESEVMKKRMATVRTTTDCYLATLTAENFMSVLKRAKKRQMASQVSFLKRFVLFKNLSQMKLQKLFYLLKECHQPKGSELFRQRDSNISGVYLIKEGEVAYDFKHEVVQPDYSKNSSWSNPSVLQNNLDKKILRREIALFTNNEIVGFEEILRKRLLAILKQEFIEGEGNDYFKNSPDKADQLFSDSTLEYRNFTAVVKSSSAKLYFLKRENLEQFLRFMPNVMVRDEVQKRVQFLSRQINTIMKVTKDEFDERQRIELAKQFITRRDRYADVLKAPTTEREELHEKVKESLAKEKDNSPQMMTLRTSSGWHTLEASRKMTLAHNTSEQQLQFPESISPQAKLDKKTKNLNGSGDFTQVNGGQSSLAQKARFRSSVWSVSHQSNQNIFQQAHKQQTISGVYGVQNGVKIGSQEVLTRIGAISPGDSQLMQDSLMSSDQQHVQSSRQSLAEQQRYQSQPRRNELMKKHFSVDTHSLDRQNKMALSSTKLNIHSISVEQLANQRGKTKFLPNLSTERPMFEDPYTQRSSCYPRLSKVNSKGKLNPGGNRTQFSHSSESPEIASRARQLRGRPCQESKQFSIRSSVESSSLPNLRQSIDSKKDIGAKIVIKEDDVGLVEAEDFVQKNFIKNLHVQDSDNNNLSLVGFSKAPISEKKQISRIRAAEHNAIQRKYDAFQSQLSMLNQTNFVGRNVQKFQNSAHSVPVQEIGSALQASRVSMTSAYWNLSDPRKDQSELKDAVTQRSTHMLPSQDERVSQADIDLAIQEEKTEFDSRMLEILDGIAPPQFDCSLNRKQIDAMHDRMSETCEIMASRQANSYRKSDDALLDKNALGPVYCKILQQRRRRGLPYKKEVLPSGKSVQTDFSDVDEVQQPSVATFKKKGLNSDLSFASIGRYSSLKHIRQEIDYSVVDNSFLIKSMESLNPQQAKMKTVSEKVPHQKLAASLDRSRFRAKMQQEKQNSEKAGFLQPRLHAKKQSCDSSPRLQVVKMRTKNSTNQQLREKLLKNKRQNTQQVQKEFLQSRMVITMADKRRDQAMQAGGETTTLSVRGFQNNNGNVSEDLYSSISVLNSIENPIIVTSRLPQKSLY